MSGVRTVYGLRFGWTTRGLDWDPVDRLVAGFARGAADEEALAPDVTLHVEARGEGGVAIDAPAGEAYRPSFFQGNVRGFARDGEILVLAPAARVTIARDGRRIDAVVDEKALIERGFVDTTLVIALSLALRHHGLFHLHAGALVRGDGRRVVILGDSGSGKTTVTLSLLDGGAQHLGDDTLFFTEREGRACLLAFPRPFHLGPATARAFPALAARPAEGEAKLHLAVDALPWRSCASMGAPDVLLFPRVTGEAKTRVTELSRADAFGMAIQSCAFVAVDGLGQKAEQLGLLRGLVEGARAFELELGRDWLEEPGRVPWESG